MEEWFDKTNPKFTAMRAAIKEVVPLGAWTEVR
jgi:hypothetical protein